MKETQMGNQIKDTNYGKNQEAWDIDYDPSKYSTPQDAAKAFYKALRHTVIAYGQNPDTELFIASPEKAAQMGYQPCWMVSWEAGPYEWAIVASMEFMYNRKDGWFTEPYYSFDLCFTS